MITQPHTFGSKRRQHQPASAVPLLLPLSRLSSLCPSSTGWLESGRQPQPEEAKRAAGQTKAAVELAGRKTNGGRQRIGSTSGTEEYISVLGLAVDQSNFLSETKVGIPVVRENEWLGGAAAARIGDDVLCAARSLQ